MSVPAPVAEQNRSLAELWLRWAGLCATFASAGLGVWELAQGDKLAAYLASNDRQAVRFASALPSMGSAVFGLCVLCLLLARRAPDARACLDWAARRTAPLALAAFLPPLRFEQVWEGRPIAFLVTLSALAVAARALFKRAFEAGPWPSAAQRAAEPTPATRTPEWQRHAPLALVLAAVAAYAAHFARITIQNHHNLDTNSFDLGIFDNIFWNTSHRWDVDLPASPYGGPDARHLGQHATLIVFLLAPLYLLAPRAETLLWIQAVGVALAAVPLYLFAARHLRPWAACTVALAYLLYPPVHGPNLYDFHFILLAPLVHWTALVLLESRRDWLALLAVLAGLSVREDAATGVAIVGAYLIVTKQRPKAGLLLGIVSTLYVVTMKLVIMPGGFGKGGSFVELYQALMPPQGAQGLGAVLTTVLANPLFVVTALLTADKLIYALQIAAPLAFLPWIRPIGWLCSVPGFFFCLLVTNAQPLYQISFQYTPHWTTYLFMALVVNLETLGARPGSATDTEPEPRRTTTAQKAALCALALAMIAGSHQFGAVMQQHTARAGYRQFVFGTTPEKQADYRDLRALIAKMPASARVVGSEHVVPHVSNRRYAYTLRYGVYDAEYILAPVNGLYSEEHSELMNQLRQSRYGVVETRGRFFLAKRGYSKARNREVIAKLR